MITKTYIEVKWDFIGFHSWPQAPEEVLFLQNDHRHVFKCRAKLEVQHDDRDLEFFIVKNKLLNLFGDNTHFGSQSCELIAKCIVKYIWETFGPRECEVEVSEDGENAGIVRVFDK